MSALATTMSCRVNEINLRIKFYLAISESFNLVAKPMTAKVKTWIFFKFEYLFIIILLLVIINVLFGAV